MRNAQGISSSRRTTCGPTKRGRPSLAQVMNDAGALPTRNWSSGTFEQIENINSDAFQKIKTRNRACYQCAIGCRQFHEAGGVARRGPRVRDHRHVRCQLWHGRHRGADAVQRFSATSGVWTRSPPATSWARDGPYREGHQGLRRALRRGGGYLKAPELIATTEGVGAELALGARALAARYGVPELAMEVKNLELPGYDPRGAFGMSLVVRDLRPGGCHMRVVPIAERSSPATLPPDTWRARPSRSSGAPGRGHHGRTSARQVHRHLVRLLGDRPGQMRALFKHVVASGSSATKSHASSASASGTSGVSSTCARASSPTPAGEALLEEPFTDGPSAGKAMAREAFGAALRSTTACAAGTRTASRARPSWPSSASTSAYRAARGEGMAMPHVDDLQEEVHRLPHVRARLFGLARRRLPAVCGSPQRQRQSDHRRDQGTDLPADDLRQVPGRLST